MKKSYSKDIAEEPIPRESNLKKASSYDSFDEYIDTLVKLRREGNETCTSLKRTPSHRPISPNPEDSPKPMIEYPVQYYIRSGSFKE